MTRRERTIYLAALLEGEGTFRLTRSGKNTTTVAIHLRMTDEDIIDWASELIRGLLLKKLYLPIRKDAASKIGKKPLYGISIQGSIAILIMKEILPFMGQRRTARIKECIDAYERRVTISEASRNSRTRQKRCTKTASMFQ